MGEHWKLLKQLPKYLHCCYCLPSALIFGNINKKYFIILGSFSFEARLPFSLRKNLFEFNPLLLEYGLYSRTFCYPKNLCLNPGNIHFWFCGMRLHRNSDVFIIYHIIIGPFSVIDIFLIYLCNIDCLRVLAMKRLLLNVMIFFFNRACLWSTLMKVFWH